MAPLDFSADDESKSVFDRSTTRSITAGLTFTIWVGDEAILAAPTIAIALIIAPNNMAFAWSDQLPISNNMPNLGEIFSASVFACCGDISPFSNR